MGEGLFVLDVHGNLLSFNKSGLEDVYKTQEFVQINATVAGKKDMEEVIAKAKENRGMYGKKTILFVDEIHRFNKGQPVSYTHLDVYKRQLQDLPQRNLHSSWLYRLCLEPV